MPTECVCVVCGARQPLVGALEAPATRDAWTAALALWGDAGSGAAAVVARYVDWFAAPERAPQARTVVRCLEDLSRRIAAGEVAAKGIARPAPLAAWIEAMRLIVDGHTEAVRPLSTNGYLAGIVWHRAGESGRPAGLVGAAAPGGASHPAATGPRAAVVRANLRGDLVALRGMLAGATTASAQESLRRQIDTAESRLAQAAGDDHGSGE